MLWMKTMPAERWMAATGAALVALALLGMFHLSVGGSSEAIALGKKNRALAQKVISKQMKVTDRNRLDVIYDASLGRMPSKPYAREEAVQLELESIAFTDPLFKNKKAADFVDSSIVAELERKGFFAQLQ